MKRFNLILMAILLSIGLMESEIKSVAPAVEKLSTSPEMTMEYGPKAQKSPAIPKDAIVKEEIASKDQSLRSTNQSQTVNEKVTPIIDFKLAEAPLAKWTNDMIPVRPQSPEVLSIINSNKSEVEIIQELTNLLMTSDDLQIAKDLTNAYGIEGVKYLAGHKTNILRIVKDSNLTSNQKINTLKDDLEYVVDTRISYIDKTYQDKSEQLYTSAIIKLQNQFDATQSPEESIIELLHQDIAILNNQRSKHWANFVTQDTLYDSSPIAEFGKYVQTTFAILAKRGYLTTRSVKSTIMSIFQQSKVNVPTDTKNEIAKNATSSIPSINASPAAQAAWISKITQMISDAIFSVKNTINQKSDEEKIISNPVNQDQSIQFLKQ